MDYFKITPDDIQIHSQLMAQKPVAALWKKYTNSKPLALRIILYAMNMADYTLTNPYGSMPPNMRKAKMIQHLFDGNAKFTGLAETLKLITHFRAMYEDIPGHSNLRALAKGNYLLRTAIENYNPKEATSEDLLTYSNLLSKFNVNTKDYVETSAKIAQLLKDIVEQYETDHDIIQPYV